MYEQEEIKRAFQMYQQLATNGRVTGELIQYYKSETNFRALVDFYCAEVDAICMMIGNEAILVPKTTLSPHHVSNETLRRTYIGNQGKNEDLYLMYFATLCCLGEFYNSFHSLKPTRAFITLEDWMRSVEDRISALQNLGEEKLEQKEEEYSYHWRGIIEKWHALDDVREGVKSQRGQTKSRVSFLHKVCQFLEKEEILIQIGDGEYSLTERTDYIIGNYFMDSEYNRGILEFLYGEEEIEDADNS